MTLAKRHVIRLIYVLVGLVVVTPLSVKGQTAQIQVITHASVTLDELSPSQVRRIFSMRQTYWPDRQKIVVYVLNNEHGIHHLFSREVLSIFPYQLERTWNKLVYSGLGHKPITVRDEQEMLDKIRRQPGAIGYVRYPMSGEGLKSIAVTKE